MAKQRGPIDVVEFITAFQGILKTAINNYAQDEDKLDLTNYMHKLYYMVVFDDKTFKYSLPAGKVSADEKFLVWNYDSRNHKSRRNSNGCVWLVKSSEVLCTKQQIITTKKLLRPNFCRLAFLSWYGVLGFIQHYLLQSLVLMWLELVDWKKLE